MEKIAIANQKGGVGKSTTAINLSSSIAEMGKTVLVIDMDPQANSTRGFGIEKYDHTIYDCFVKGIPLSESIVHTNYHVDVIPSDILLANAELELSTVIGREQILRELFRDSKVDNYNYIFIDCNPSLGLLTVNALSAVNSILIPLEPAPFSLKSIEQLIKVMNLIKRKINYDIDIKGVLLTRADRRTNIEKEIFEELQNIFPQKIFRTIIHQNVKISQAQIEGKPINYFAPNSIGAKEYMALAREMIERG